MSLHSRINALPWKSKLALGRAVLSDQRVPLGAKLVAPAIVLYLLMPFDIIPDFIPVLGQIDDLLVIAGGLWLFLRLCPPDIIDSHLASLEDSGGP